ncbi:hypothetical protein OnM2_081034, partial [Erysiphe neolycopersici]
KQNSSQTLVKNVTYQVFPGNDLTNDKCDPFSYISVGHYTSEKWHGIMLDHGSQSYSTAGRWSGSITAKSRIGKTSSIGSIEL